MLQRRSFLLTSLLACAAGSTALAADPWTALRSGRAFVLLRHAVAPGTGDPAGMRLGDCSTQRNLSAEGRLQAQRIGALFRENGIGEAEVFSSQWCRCLDTANLLGLGPVTPQPLLNSFFGQRDKMQRQTESLRDWIRARQQAGLPLVLVTHQVNITGLTAIVPSSGELVFATLKDDGDVSVIGRQSSRA
jgi:phosphohistidine phosphatase SixA